jgi:16S rRNA (guanine(966)-N(2))-methyltransferase RsmD
VKPASQRGKAAGPPREVRIIGGQWKRSKLPVADAPGLRPTPDRVRETLFNWLGQDLTGWRCLDAFAGSGALGFEAASRGAAEVVLLEREASLVKLLQASQARLKADAVRVQAGDGLAFMQRAAPGTFDLVFLDPPFGAGLHERALAAAAPLVAPGGWIYLEAGEAFADEQLRPHALALHRQARAGQVHAHLLQRKAVADAA